ncbi:hypothetical protein SARC_01220 [Sphaeroforma arctica JP610]|uniref:AH domain-containing protein n=1 Tax=Sphaeroforma arctica JP610 TaxID=667725 RepID=A0A0L0GCC0_9EUKA|nr:hypothetical protein SARC_01220 [Sphaeroforma arctica JP610]KNC86640.1 hypothetical protein SARC_01220 [Sphaeroforma arctica JP610]|eukprot:XP_014160542.1 hypothetical protein SARC_01220 [Sphaeroforma arctica JP610]
MAETSPPQTPPPTDPTPPASGTQSKSSVNSSTTSVADGEEEANSTTNTAMVSSEAVACQESAEDSVAEHTEVTLENGSDVITHTDITDASDTKSEEVQGDAKSSVTFDLSSDGEHESADLTETQSDGQSLQQATQQISAYIDGEREDDTNTPTHTHTKDLPTAETEQQGAQTSSDKDITEPTRGNSTDGTQQSATVATEDDATATDNSGAEASQKDEATPKDAVGRSQSQSGSSTSLWGSLKNIFVTVPTYEADPELDDALESLERFSHTFAESVKALSMYRKAFITMTLQIKHLAKALNDEGMKTRGDTGRVLRNMGESLKDVHTSQQDLSPLLSRMESTWDAFITRGVPDAQQAAADVLTAREKAHAAQQRRQRAGEQGNNQFSEVYLIYQAMEAEYKDKREAFLAKATMLDLQHCNIFRKDLKEFEIVFKLHAQNAQQVLHQAMDVHKDIVNSQTKTPSEFADNLLLARKRSVPNLQLQC